MGEYLRFELRFRDVPFRNVSLRVAEVDAGRLLAGGEAIAELLFSPSDSAKSCLMISPFSHFSAFLGPTCACLRQNSEHCQGSHNSNEYDAHHYVVFHEMCGQSGGSTRNFALIGAAGRRLPKLLSPPAFAVSSCGAWLAKSGPYSFPFDSRRLVSVSW